MEGTCKHSASSRCGWPPHFPDPHHRAGRPGWVSYLFFTSTCDSHVLVKNSTLHSDIHCANCWMQTVSFQTWPTQYIPNKLGKGHGSWVSYFYLPWEEVCIWIVLKADKLSISTPVQFSYIMIDQGIFFKSLPCQYKESTSWDTPPCWRAPSTSPPIAPIQSCPWCEGLSLVEPAWHQLDWNNPE